MIGPEDDRRSITLARGKAIELSHGADTDFYVSEVGLYIFVHTNIGVTLSWDRGTWAEVRLEPYHHSKVGIG